MGFFFLVFLFLCLSLPSVQTYDFSAPQERAFFPVSPNVVLPKLFTAPMVLFSFLIFLLMVFLGVMYTRSLPAKTQAFVLYPSPPLVASAFVHHVAAFPFLPIGPLPYARPSIF